MSDNDPLDVEIEIDLGLEEPVAEAETPKAGGQQTLMGYGSDA